MDDCNYFPAEECLFQSLCGNKECINITICNKSYYMDENPYDVD